MEAAPCAARRALSCAIVAVVAVEIGQGNLETEVDPHHRGVGSDECKARRKGWKRVRALGM